VSKRVRATLVVGPGQHDDALCVAMSEFAERLRIVRSWPTFVVTDYIKHGPHRQIVAHPFFARLSWLAWAMWRRLPKYLRIQSPQEFLNILAGRLSKSHVDGCQLLVGFAMVSLECLERARQVRALAVLEHAMVHVDVAMSLAEDEYKKWDRTGQPYSRLSSAMIRRMRKEYDAADFICVLSTFAEKSFHNAGVDKRKIVKVSLGVDIAAFSPGPPRVGAFRILFVGRLEFPKGVQYLLQAFASISHSDAELWLVGHACPEIESCLKELEDDRIRIVGEVPHGDISMCYQQSDVLVFPTICDSFGLVILEAMACGLPVIATTNSAAPDIIDEGVDGFVVPIRDAEAIRCRLLYLYDHRDILLEMGRAARKKVCNHFSSSCYSDQIGRLYAALLMANEENATREL